MLSFYLHYLSIWFSSLGIPSVISALLLPFSSCSVLQHLPVHPLPSAFPMVSPSIAHQFFQLVLLQVCLQCMPKLHNLLWRTKLSGRDLEAANCFMKQLQGVLVPNFIEVEHLFKALHSSKIYRAF